MKHDESRCPLCSIQLNRFDRVAGSDAVRLDCPTCGTFTISETLLDMNRDFWWDNQHVATAISHAITKMNRRQKYPMVTPELVEQLTKHPVFPSPPEQADNVLLWLGESIPGPGHLVSLTPAAHRAIAGSPTDIAFEYVLKYLFEEGLLQGDELENGAHATITFKGWTRYDALRRGRTDSRKAFMAIPFNNPQMDKLFECFKAAARATGFELVRLDEKPKAGLIDARLRVEIRTSRFLVADLTDGNQGAYWEAGFAEGLEKPVIYSCEQSVFKKGTHFDANHLYTVVWDADKLDDAAEELKVAIRATLPDEAKMTDDSRLE